MKPIVYAKFKCVPADFVVKECLTKECLNTQVDDECTNNMGEHLWLYVKKIGINTEHLVKCLAKVVGIPAWDIGYSGLKDRHAITYQWLSLRLPKLTDSTIIQQETQKLLNADEVVEVLKCHWHHKKLNRGTHKANCFDIALTEVVGDKNAIESVLTLIKTMGVPNFFGQQRFGTNQHNLDEARTYCKKLLKTKNPKRKLSQKEAFLVSVMRSALFNQVLQARVEVNAWHTAIAGDVFNLNRTNSVFVAEVDEEIHARMALGDIHSTAPLFGVEGKIKSSDKAFAIESAVFTKEDNQLFVQTLLKLGIKSDRRPLRVLPNDLNWQWQDNQLMLSFSLPKGAFATSVLTYLVEELVDGADRVDAQ